MEIILFNWFCMHSKVSKLGSLKINKSKTRKSHNKTFLNHTKSKLNKIATLEIVNLIFFFFQNNKLNVAFVLRFYYESRSYSSSKMGIKLKIKKKKWKIHYIKLQPDVIYHTLFVYTIWEITKENFRLKC